MGYLSFLDDWSFLSMHNFERKLGQPTYVPEATLEDLACEGTWDFPCVAYIEEEKKFIGLYIAAIVPKCGVDIPPAKRDFVPKNGVICYCESQDGIHWVKPDMTAVVELEDRQLPNQVSGPFEGSPVFYDKWTGDSTARFKAMFNYKSDGSDGHAPGDTCRALMVSPDGIHWRPYTTYWNIGSSDSPSSLCYDPEGKMYYLYARKFNGDRRVWGWRTKDFSAFEEMGLCMHPDPMDKPMVGFYGMPTFKYENVFFGLLWRIYCNQIYQGLANGPMDVGLTYSYDGSHFNRASYAPFIPRNPMGEHGGGCVYTSSMVVVHDEVRFYSGGSKAEHFQDQTLSDAAIMMHRMRLDGFMYLESISRAATLRTKGLRFSGDQLKINVKCPHGMARVQILDEKGRPMPGFTFDDCTPLVRGDELYWQPDWHGKTAADTIDGRKRRYIELEITSGQVFAIRGDFTMLTTHHEKDI